MSVQTLSSGQINSTDITFNVAGAITGSFSVNLKRFNNIVYFSLPLFTATVGVSGPTILLAPATPVPAQYKPVAGITRELVLTDNNITAPGFITFSNNMTLFAVTLQTGASFTGISGVRDNTIMWNAAN